jgi:hypothetical protein
MGHGDYERLTPEAIGPAVVRLRAGDGGEADRAGAGSVYEHGARLPAPVRRDPPGSAAAGAEPAESG